MDLFESIDETTLPKASTQKVGSTPSFLFKSLSCKAPQKEGLLKSQLGYKISKYSLAFYTMEPKGVLIEFSLANAFIASRESQENVSFYEAMFSMEENITRHYDRQSIDQWTQEPNALIIGGELTPSSRDRAPIPYTLTFTEDSYGDLEFTLKSPDPRCQRLSLRFQSDKSEQFFGFGQQLTHFNLKGHIVPINVEESGVGRGGKRSMGDLTASGNDYTTYAPMPRFITSFNRGLLLAQTKYTVFDLSLESEVRIDTWDSELKGMMQGASSPLALISQQTARTGRHPPLPEWASGTILGLQGGSKRVLEITEKTISTGNPVTAIWIQDWEGKRQTAFGSRLWWRWQPDTKLYPDFQKFCAKMHDKGLKVLGYINPFLADEGAMFEEAKKYGYLVKNQAGEIYPLTSVGTPMALLDITNPKACEWIKNIIKTNMIDNGLDGWMADFGEYLPYDAVLSTGADPRSFHNLYPVEWARINKEAIAESGRKDILFFMRAAFSGSSSYCQLFWTGDQLVSFDIHDGLPSAIVGLLSSGVSGMALNHCDIGGYTASSTTTRSREIFERWAEFCAFTPVFRTHEGNRPYDNHQFYEDKETLLFFKKMADIHFALAPYLRFLMDEAFRTGAPVICHPFLHFPKDKHTYTLKYQFMVGEHLMVLPVFRAETAFAEGYLPQGLWQHIFTGKVYSGPKVYQHLPAPRGEPCAFLRLSDNPWFKKLASAFKKSRLL